MSKQRGFSLIELLIVVSIILIIAAIAVPNLLRSRQAANEASAVGSIRTINTSEVTYQTTYPTAGYATTLAALGGSSCTTPSSAAACLIDNTLASATSSTTGKSGYYFTLASDTTLGYTLLGTPNNFGSTGGKNYYSDSTGVIHYNTTSGTASTATDPAVQ